MTARTFLKWYRKQKQELLIERLSDIYTGQTNAWNISNKRWITMLVFHLKLRCDCRFQHAFTACSCVFKVITLVGSNQVITLKMQLHVVNSRWKWVSLCSFTQIIRSFMYSLKTKILLSSIFYTIINEYNSHLNDFQCGFCRF